MPRPPQPLTLLDACTVVNLYATRWMKPILVAVTGPVAIADVVAREAQYVFRGGTGDDAREREAVDLQPLRDDGLLQVISSEVEEELQTYIDLSREVGLGEAMTAALAIHRGAIVVTDDRKASRILTARGVALLTSLDLIRVWSERSAVSDSLLSTALLDVRQRGSYEPPRAHPHRPWWDQVLNRA